MAVFILVANILCAFVIGFGLGYYTSHDINDTIKRENERLNQKLQKHNVRDSRGRFTRSKK
jgi:hypothetical protein